MMKNGKVDVAECRAVSVAFDLTIHVHLGKRMPVTDREGVSRTTALTFGGRRLHDAEYCLVLEAQAHSD